ncbi:MAG: hypothetical protein ACR2LL_06875 [Nitrosopumilus sp.]
MQKYGILTATVVIISLLTMTTHYAFSETDPIQINISIPLEGSTEFCGKLNTCFIPIEVITLVGAKVTWTNDDSANTHTVTSGDVVVGPDGMFDSGVLGPQQSFSYVFEQAGIFPYYCTIHPWKEGVIKVSSQESDRTQFSPISEKSSLSSSSASLDDEDVEKLRQENAQLKLQIKELQDEIENLKLLVLEQLKVINQWISSR